MSMPVDNGIRCDRHVGELFQVRCYDCQQEAIEEEASVAETLETRDQ